MLDQLRTLGRSGLAVSPLTLGTMTFGQTTWGSSDETAAAVFTAYVEAGGNAVDTADVYSGGRSEELVGRLVHQRRLRDRLVLATKYGFSAEPGNALAGGSSRKNLHRALTGSLHRLGTDYVDLYWMHVWDGVTPAEEVLQSLTDLVRAGLIRYYGFSDLPAWFVARVATLAAAHGVPGPIALQMEYSLVAREVEREHVPAAQALGIGLVPWSPLAGGFLTGKYARNGGTVSGAGRLREANPFGESKFTDQNFAALDAVTRVAEQAGSTASQVALAWLADRPAVATTVIGARTTDQLHDNLGSLAVGLSAADRARLSEAGGFALGFPYDILSPDLRAAAVHGGVSVTAWRG